MTDIIDSRIWGEFESDQNVEALVQCYDVEPSTSTDPVTAPTSVDEESPEIDHSSPKTVDYEIRPDVNVLSNIRRLKQSSGNTNQMVESAVSTQQPSPLLSTDQVRHAHDLASDDVTLALHRATACLVAHTGFAECDTGTLQQLAQLVEHWLLAFGQRMHRAQQRRHNNSTSAFSTSLQQVLSQFDMASLSQLQLYYDTHVRRL